MEKVKQSLVNFPIICPTDKNLSFTITYTPYECTRKNFDDLLEKVKDKITKSNKQYFLLRNYYLKSLHDHKDKTLDYFEQLAPFYIEFFDNPLIKVILREKEFKKEEFFEYNPNEKISDFQKKIGYIFNSIINYRPITTKGRNLSFESKMSELDSDEDLEFIDKRKEAACMFVDLEKNLTKDLKFSNEAPIYRKCKQGINIFGICSTEKCPAFNHEVIFQVEDLTFDMILSSDEVICPLCKEGIIPETCGFWNCYYTFSGIKKEKKKCRKVSGLKWEYACKEKFSYFQKEDQSSWTNLKLFVSFEKPEDACPICLKKIIGNFQKLDCNHTYHKECIDSQTIRFNFSCIMCSNF